MSKIIKCMFFVLLAAVLPLSVHAQQVTLHLQDVTVRKAFRELEVKGNVSLVYEKNDVDPVSYTHLTLPTNREV